MVAIDNSLSRTPTGEPDPTEPIVAEDGDAILRKQLIARIATAGMIILGLLGGLAVFELLNQPPAPALPKMAAETTVQEPLPEPVKPAEPAIEKTEAASVPAEPEHTETALETPRNNKPLTLPATPRTASIKPPPPAVAPAKPEPRQDHARVVPERSAPAGAPANAPARAQTQTQTASVAPGKAPGQPVANPSSSAAHAAAQTAPVAVPANAMQEKPTVNIVESAKRFLIQVGVFSNPINAEELATKLQAAGIPAQVESRVQVGPFASRAEVDAARAKLKGMGIDDGLLVKR